MTGELKPPALNPAEVPARVSKLLEERRAAEREIEALKQARRGEAAADLLSEVREIRGVKVLAVRADGADAAGMRSMVDDLRARARLRLAKLERGR